MTNASPPMVTVDELDWLRKLATRLAAGGDEDDLVQETVLAAWQANPQSSPDRPLRPWLAAVARNRARMDARARTRRARREHDGAALVTPSAAASPDDELARIRALQAVCSALDDLPELDRRIIIRRFVDEENATQIGERLGIPAATVRSRLRRALAQLRATLEQRHRGWALALIGPVPRGEASAGAIGLGAKLGFTLTIGAVAVGAWSSCDRESESDAAQATSSEPSPQTQWEQRRAKIRAALSEQPADEKSSVERNLDLDAEAVELARDDMLARARAGFSEFKSACFEDLDSGASGAITLSAIVIGDPHSGTIFDSVAIVTETVDDPEIIACVREAMYAYVGDPPPMPLESPLVKTTMWMGPDEDDARRERVIFEAIVGAHHSEIAFCQRDDASIASGTALLELTIGTDSRAKSHVVRSDLPDSVLDCIVKANERWAFPKTMVDQMFQYEFRLPVEGLDPQIF